MSKQESYVLYALAQTDQLSVEELSRCSFETGLVSDPRGYGRFIAGVRMPLKGDTPAFMAVLISQGADIAELCRCSFLHDPLAPGAVKIRCPEIALVVQGSAVTAALAEPGEVKYTKV